VTSIGSEDPGYWQKAGNFNFFEGITGFAASG